MASACTVTFVPFPPRWVPRLYWVIFQSPCAFLYIDGAQHEARWSRSTSVDVDPGPHHLKMVPAGGLLVKPLELSLEVTSPIDVVYRAPFLLLQRGTVIVRPSLEPSAQ